MEHFEGLIIGLSLGFSGVGEGKSKLVLRDMRRIPSTLADCLHRVQHCPSDVSINPKPLNGLLHLKKPQTPRQDEGVLVRHDQQVEASALAWSALRTKLSVPTSASQRHVLDPGVCILF